MPLVACKRVESHEKADTGLIRKSWVKKPRQVRDFGGVGTEIFLAMAIFLYQYSSPINNQ